MLQISDKGLRDFANEYKKIILNKFRVDKDYKTKFEEIKNIVEKKNANIVYYKLEELLLLEYTGLRQAIESYNDLVFEDENEKRSVVNLLKSVFKYSSKIDRELRNKILNKVGINVCPYCGRQFISSYVDDDEGRNSMNDDKEKNSTDDDEERNSAELDHFFAKKHYPFLALSLYNFVPSCSICNSRHKRDEDFFKNEHLYPYKEGFGNKTRFDIDEKILISDLITANVEDLIKLTGNKENVIKIIRDKNDKKINNNIETFRLESLYKNHVKDVQYLFRLIQIYNRSYVNNIVNVLDNNTDTSLDDLPKECKDEKLKELNKKIDDMLMIMFREKNNDEILSKLHNDLLDKYWRNI